MQKFNHSSDNVVGGSSALGNSTKNSSNAAQSAVVINNKFTNSSSLHCRHKNHTEHVTTLCQQEEEEEECKKLNREEFVQNKYESKRRRFVWWRRALSNMLFRLNKKHYNAHRRKETDNSDNFSSSLSSESSRSSSSPPYVDKNNEGKSELYDVQSYNEFHHANADELRAARLRERRQQVHNSTSYRNKSSTYRQNKKQFQEKCKLNKETWEKENECDWKCCLWCAVGILLIGMVWMGIVFYVLYVHDDSFREWLHSFHVMKRYNPMHAKINGWSSLEHPELLPSLQIRLPRKMSSTELLAKYKSVDFVYTYVNGSEQNHVYRKLIWDACGAEMLKKEELLYEETMQTDNNRNNVNNAYNSTNYTTSYECTSNDLFTLPTTREVLEYIQHQSERSVNSRDRDWDELKYSIRSVEQNIAWHRGRLMIVSPGHIPHWLHLARNFFGNNSLHTSTMTEYVYKSNWLTEKTNIINSYHHLTLVHQDALLPHYTHMTFNSHVIEEHLWRLRNLSAMHIYFNDDYFVNRPVSISDFFNEYGGSVIRTESKKIKQAVRAHAKSISWMDSVKHVHLFATVELDVHAEDYLPPSLALKWSEAIMEEQLIKTSKHNRLLNKEEEEEEENNELSLQSVCIPATLLSHWIDVALHDPPPPSLPWSITPRDLAMLHKLNHNHNNNYSYEFLQEKSKEHEELEVSLEKQFESEMIDTNTEILVESGAVSDTDNEEEEEEELLESSQLLLLSPPEANNNNNTLQNDKKEKKLNGPLKTKRRSLTNKLTANQKKAIIQEASSREKKLEEKKEGRWQARWAQTHLPTHSPFVYCTNMFRYFATRYERELSHVDYYNRKRMANNYLMPLMYSAFALSRPWQASPSFLPYLMQHHKMIDVKRFTEVNIEESTNNITTTYTNDNSKRLISSAEVEWVIDLNNDDGCAPITQLVGNASDTLYTKLTDNKVLTAIMANRLQRNNPLFFNINAGCNSSECAKYMYLLLESKYASPIYLDEDDELVHELNASDALINDAFHSLMQLPLIVLTLFEENICPLIRSLQFAMPAFTGDIYVIVEEIEEDGNDINTTNLRKEVFVVDDDHNIEINKKSSRNKSKLEQVRKAYHFTLRSATPVLGCTYNDKVHINHYYKKYNKASSSFSQNSDIEQLVTHLLHPKQNNNSAFINRKDDVVKLPSFLNMSYANKTISAFFIDTRIALPAELHVSEQVEHQSKRTQELETLLRTVLAIPAELLSLKDFTVLTTTKLMPESAEYVATVTKESNNISNDVDTITAATQKTQRDDVRSVLVLRRECESDHNNTIHWITGGTERDLLVSYPLPYEKYENLSAPPL